MSLFDPLVLRDVTIPNRIVVSPMCMYSCEDLDGMANDWHLVHLGSFATGGAGLVFTEATAVEARGRISPEDLGIWDDRHVEPLERVTRFIHSQGALIGMQLAHAGRKASTYRPWAGIRGHVPAKEGGWDTIAPSAIPFSTHDPRPEALNRTDITAVVGSFRDAARRARDAGFDVLEIHAAHGYLLHQFLSPASNRRDDEYGGTLAHRMRFVLEVVDAVRDVWPDGKPLFMRVSVTDWAETLPGDQRASLASGRGPGEPLAWDIDQTVELAKAAAEHGVDLIDCSSAGILTDVKIPFEPGYHVPYARRIRREAGVATGVVGLVLDARQADGIIQDGDADMVVVGRQMLRNPRWPLQAAHELGVEPAPGAWRPQYERARQLEQWLPASRG